MYMHVLTSNSMKRKAFIKSLAVSAAGIAASPALAVESRPKKESVPQIVGFNHLPVKEIKTMKTVLHLADSRSNVDHGWLKARHTFSFANYYNPERIHFGVLRVLNDDQIAGGMGFGMHPHDNMEIITIPLSGTIEHKDSMGSHGIIQAGEVQVMSAGTGVTHSEFNHNKDELLKLLQIWVIPQKHAVTPRYDQATYDATKTNEFVQVVSPFDQDEAGLKIHQNARFYLGNLTEGFGAEYNIKAEGNGLYVFVIDGNITVDSQKLSTRDGYGIWDTESVYITADSNAKVLLMDLPMAV